MGSNGAGKSTFFLNLNGVLWPKEGKIVYRGKQIGKKDLNHLRKHVGFVFQDADNQMIASSVQAEVAFGPVNLKAYIAKIPACQNFTGFSSSQKRNSPSYPRETMAS